MLQLKFLANRRGEIAVAALPLPLPVHGPKITSEMIGKNRSSSLTILE